MLAAPLIYPPTGFQRGARQTGLVRHFSFSAKFICMGKQKNRLTAAGTRVSRHHTTLYLPYTPHSNTVAMHHREASLLESSHGLPYTRRGSHRVSQSLTYPIPHLLQSQPRLQPSLRQLQGRRKCLCEISAAAYPIPHQPQPSPTQPLLPGWLRATG